MKNFLVKLLTLVFVSTSLISCSSSNTREQNTTGGAVTGAVVGGLAGSLIGGGVGKAVAVGVGIVGGALVGGYVGKSMDSSDNVHATQVLSKNPVNKSTTWKNKKTGKTYTMKPTRQVTVNGNPNCRMFTTTVRSHGQKHVVNGTACPQADGSWKTVS